MRVLLLILAAMAALFALALLADMADGGTYIEVIAFGVFFVAASVAAGCAGVMARLEEIRDRKL